MCSEFLLPSENNGENTAQGRQDRVPNTDVNVVHDEPPSAADERETPSPVPSRAPSVFLPEKPERKPRTASAKSSAERIPPSGPRPLARRSCITVPLRGILPDRKDAPHIFYEADRRIRSLFLPKKRNYHFMLESAVCRTLQTQTPRFEKNRNRIVPNASNISIGRSATAGRNGIKNNCFRLF